MREAKEASRELALGSLLEDEKPVGSHDLLPAVDLAANVDERLELVLRQQLEPGVVGDASPKFRPLQQQPVAVLLVREDADLRVRHLSPRDRGQRVLWICVLEPG